MPLTGCCFYRVEGGRTVLGHQLSSLSPYWLDRYCHHFWRFDPLHPQKMDQSAARLQLLTRDSLRDDATREYFEKFLMPQKTVHQVELYFRQGPQIIAGASLLRNDATGAFSADNLTFLEKLVAFVEGSIFKPEDDHSQPGISGLTPREEEIAILIGAAVCNKEICRRLNIELPTVKTHVSRVLAKAGVRSRAELVKKLNENRAWPH
ncbi:response regulator transcription factor [Rhizobium sp. RAF56]|uniref:helix-turn-helix transcriptional regulator n=1 Tax=Rhizobium sp. RAF56 TaxID=3233062 RepID=UPI003F954BFC